MSIRPEGRHNTDNMIALHSLCRGVQFEIIELGAVVLDIQKAIGEAVKEMTTLKPSTYATLQSIDMLTQTLDDLQRVLGHVSDSAEKGKYVLETAELTTQIHLGGLSHKLLKTTSTSTQLPAASEDFGDIAWF